MVSFFRDFSKAITLALTCFRLRTSRMGVPVPVSCCSEAVASTTLLFSGLLIFFFDIYFISSTIKILIISELSESFLLIYLFFIYL